MFWVGDAVFADAAIQLVAGIDLGTGQGRADGQTPAACRMAQHNLIFSAVKQEGMVYTAAQSKLFILACKHIADACGGMKIKRRTLGIAEFSGGQAIGINAGVCIAVHLQGVVANILLAAREVEVGVIGDVDEGMDSLKNKSILTYFFLGIQRVTPWDKALPECS